MPRFSATSTTDTDTFKPTLVAGTALPLSPFKLAVLKVMPGVQTCYRELLERDENAEGNFSVRLKVRRASQDTGRIDSATIEAPTEPDRTELVSPAFQQCVLEAFVKGEFPAPPPGEELEEHVVPFGFGGYSGEERAKRAALGAGP